MTTSTWGDSFSIFFRSLACSSTFSGTGASGSEYSLGRYGSGRRDAPTSRSTRTATRLPDRSSAGRSDAFRLKSSTGAVCETAALQRGWEGKG